MTCLRCIHAALASFQAADGIYGNNQTKEKREKKASIDKFPHDCSTVHLWAFTVKEDCGSDGEDNMCRDTLVEEMLLQRDTAVIYPEAPEDECRREDSPDATFSDENGT